MKLDYLNSIPMRKNLAEKKLVKSKIISSDLYVTNYKLILKNERMTMK